MAYARTKIDRVSWASTSFVMPNSALMLVRAGEIIEDEIGETSVNAETMNVAAHLRFIDPGGCISSRYICVWHSGILLTVLWILRIVIRIPCDQVRVFDRSRRLLFLQWRRILNIMFVWHTTSDLFVGPLLSMSGCIRLF
jgi:hypothetical protein